MVLALTSFQALASAEKTSITMVKALQRLDQAGYRYVHEIKYKRGVYRVEAIDAGGQKVKLKVNAQTGMIQAPKGSNKPYLSMLQVAQKIQAAGYANISKIEFDDGRYEAKVYDPKGNKIKLYINPVSGEIRKRW